MHRECRKCGRKGEADIGPSAACPQCGAIYSKVQAALEANGGESARSGASDPDSGNKTVTNGSAARLGWLILAIAIAWWVYSWTEPAEPEPERTVTPAAPRTEPTPEPVAPAVPEYDKYDASAACKHFVKARLKAPATADFPWDAGDIYGSGSGPWTVNNYVDAQNAFGANIRSRYACTVHFVGDMMYLDEMHFY